MRCCWTSTLIFNPLLDSTGGSFILHSLHVRLPRQTCNWLAALHLSEHRDWQPGHVCSRSLSPPRLGCFFVFFHASFPAGIWLLSGNSPDCLPVVVGNGWQWFGLKCYQMRCGGVNPDIFPLLYSLLPLLVSVHLRRSEAKWTEVHYLHSR